MDNLNRSLLIALFTLIGLTSVAPRSYADSVIYRTGFEFPPFVVGQLVSQDGWVGVPPLSLSAAVVSKDLPFAGRQSVQVRGVNLVHQDFINSVTNGYYDAIGSYRKPVNYDVAANGFPRVRIGAKVRIDGPLSPSGNNFFSASIAARGNTSGGSTAGIGELAISSDGHVYGYSGDENVPSFKTSAPITLGEWHTLAIHLNFTTRTYSFFVDGTPLPGGPFPFVSTADTNILARGSLVVYAAPETQTLHKSAYAAYYDNFSIKPKRDEGEDDEDMR
jgi:hypothetical protein